jgi:hypothetical protein
MHAVTMSDLDGEKVAMSSESRDGQAVRLISDSGLPARVRWDQAHALRARPRNLPTALEASTAGSRAAPPVASDGGETGAQPLCERNVHVEHDGHRSI